MNSPPPTSDTAAGNGGKDRSGRHDEPNRLSSRSRSSSNNTHVDDGASIKTFHKKQMERFGPPRFPYLVLVILVAAAVTATTATLVYKTTRARESDDFYESFLSDSNHVNELVNERLYSVLGSVDSYLVSLISMARSTNQTWPFVTMPDAALRLTKLRKHTRAISVGQAHFVTAAQRQAWEEYASTHLDWTTEALRLQETTSVVGYSQPNIHGSNGASMGDGPFLPSWYSSPFVPEIAPYNSNVLENANLAEVLAEILEHKVVVIGRMDNFFDALSDSTFNSYHGPYFDDYVTSSVAKEPMSCLFVPIVDNATNLVPIVPSAESNDNRTIFGIMTVHVYWRDLLEGILPFHKTEVAIVVRNDCGQAYTYKVDSGNSPTYLGPGDLHDPAFDGTSVDLQIPGRYSSTARQYTGLPLGGEFCPYTLSVYPTQRRKNQFVTRLPIIMVATHAFIFVFTGVLFMLHRTFVERKRCGIFLYATHLYNCLDMFSLHARQGGEVDGTSVNAVNAAPAPPPPPPPAPMLATMLPPSAMTRVAGEDSNDNANIALASSQKQLEQVAAIATLVDAVPDYKDQCQLEPVGIRLLQQHPPAANVFHVADSDDDDEQAQA